MKIQPKTETFFKTRFIKKTTLM